MKANAKYLAAVTEDDLVRIYDPQSGNDGYVAVRDLAGTGPIARINERVSAPKIVSVDLPSIAAGATAATTASVTGARTGDLSDATSVLCSPPASFVSAGLLLLNCYSSANDGVTLVVNNPTAGAVDLGAANFAFWVVR